MDEHLIEKKLASIGQSHLLKHWGGLSHAQKVDLEAQVGHLDIKIFHEQQRLLHASKVESRSITPFLDYALAGNKEDSLLGHEMIAKGHVGCLIVAGGQGTRLGFDGPKGMFPISTIKHKSLFQLFAEKVVAASKQANRLLPLAIMTSPLNHNTTIDFFKKHHFFGLDKTQLSFFPQYMLPFLNTNGNLLLENQGSIAEGPDGNGSALHNFYHCGIWNQWHDRGIRILNFVVIDNPLADPFDAELIGFQRRHNSDVIVKCAIKHEAHEKVGVLANENGKVVVIEYSELSDKERSAKDQAGSLAYRCANLSLFCLDMHFIKKVALTAAMPLHKAFKAVKHLHENGLTIQPKEPMAWKFERFIFDILTHASKVNALLYPREECFAPLKNASGSDSPDTVRIALQKRDHHIMERITHTASHANPIEISQEFYYPSHELLNKWRDKEILHSGYIDS